MVTQNKSQGSGSNLSHEDRVKGGKNSHKGTTAGKSTSIGKKGSSKNS